MDEELENICKNLECNDIVITFEKENNDCIMYVSLGTNGTECRFKVESLDLAMAELKYYITSYLGRN